MPVDAAIDEVPPNRLDPALIAAVADKVSLEAVDAVFAPVPVEEVSLTTGDPVAVY